MGRQDRGDEASLRASPVSRKAIRLGAHGARARVRARDRIPTRRPRHAAVDDGRDPHVPGAGLSRHPAVPPEPGSRGPVSRADRVLTRPFLTTLVRLAAARRSFYRGGAMPAYLRRLGWVLALIAWTAGCGSVDPGSPGSSGAPPTPAPSSRLAFTRPGDSFEPTARLYIKDMLTGDVQLIAGAPSSRPYFRQLSWAS